VTYPTLTDLQTWLGISSTLSANPHKIVLDGAIAYVEKYTGRKFVAAEGTRLFIWDSRHWIVRRRKIVFFEDAAAITTVTLPDGTVTTEYDTYEQAPPYRGIVLRSDVVVLSTPPDSIFFTIVADWGYSASCPDDVKYAILTLAQQQLGVKQGRKGDGSIERSGMVLGARTIPRDVKNILDRYKIR
jgi:hypothetical protein